MNATEPRCFADATPWPNGDQPLMAGRHVWFVVADAEGVEAIADCGDTIFRLPVKFPTQLAAAAFLRGLPGEDFDPAAFGFAQL